MRTAPTALALLALGTLPYACGASADQDEEPTGRVSTTSGPGTGGAGGGADCGMCFDGSYLPCEGDPIECPEACSPGIGCTECPAGGQFCVGDDIVACNDDGTPGGMVDTCDPNAGLVCDEGMCRTRCELAADQPSNVGCEFWAVDLDQFDFVNDPASMTWGVALSNASDIDAEVVVEINEAAPGAPLDVQELTSVTVGAGQLYALGLPIRELDCGVQPNDAASPGTCLSSKAVRIRSNAPIVVYQFNVFENAFSNDASLLLPTNALGQSYRAINWSAGHPAPVLSFPADRSYVTVVGVEENTNVTVKPTWRIRGNPPIDATDPGGEITVTLGPFDVLNLETDDATLQQAGMVGVSDLTGTTVVSNKPVAVFSGVELTSSPYHVDIPTYPGWDDQSCCLDHLEEQLFPLESIGTKYLVTRSPIRSTGSYVEPDVLRFVGAAETATVTTSLPPPFDSFTLQPGEVRDTWTDQDIVVTSSAPVMVGQLLISQGYVEGAAKGDPALTVFPPVEQFRSEYVILTPGSWLENWVVIAAELDTAVTIDGASPTNCVLGNVVTLEGVDYQARRCPLQEGSHAISGDAPIGIVAYGYGNAGSYAFTGGADVKRIYEVPVLE